MTDTNANSNPEVEKRSEAEAEVGTQVDGQSESQAESQQAANQQTESQATSPNLEDLVSEWKNKAAYLAAEIDNMKKRFVREKAEVIKMANEELIRAILPVYDNLDLALKSIRDVEQKAENNLHGNKLFVNLLKGVEMTLTHFQQTLERVGVQKLESVGTPFDPSLHEAMGQSSDENFEDNHVSSEFQKGFILHGRVIRPAKVIVNKVSKA